MTSSSLPEFQWELLELDDDCGWEGGGEEVARQSQLRPQTEECHADRTPHGAPEPGHDRRLDTNTNDTVPSAAI